MMAPIGQTFVAHRVWEIHFFFYICKLVSHLGYDQGDIQGK